MACLSKTSHPSHNDMKKTVIFLTCLSSSFTFGQIINPSFERNNLDDNNLQTSSELAPNSFPGDKDAIANGWSFSGGGGVFEVKVLGATTDQRFGIGLANGQAEQKLSFSNPGNYTFNIDVFIEQDDKRNEYGWFLRNNSGAGSFVFNDTGAAGINFKNNTASSITLSQSFQITDTNTSYTLNLQNRDADRDGRYTFFDNATVKFSKIPEPSSTLLVSLSGLALMIRRKR